jgi:hypothetical protein
LRVPATAWAAFDVDQLLAAVRDAPADDEFDRLIVGAAA